MRELEPAERGRSPSPAIVRAPSIGPRLCLEKGSREQFKQALDRGLRDGCLGGAVFYRAADGAWLPARCGAWSCPECGPDRAQAVRRGLYRAARELGLVDVLTLTLPAGARGSTPQDSRTALSRLFNAVRTRLRTTALCARGVGVPGAWRCGKVWRLTKRRRACPACGCETWIPLLKEYVAVPEWHQDGAAHLHVAVNLEGLRAALWNEYADVQVFLEDAWQRVGGGWLWFGAARRQDAPRKAAAYLSKYLGKMQAKAPPWDELRYCAEDGGFRRRPWHRFMASRNAGRIVASVADPRKTGPTAADLELPLTADAGFTLARPVLEGGELVGFDAWHLAEGSAIVDGCDGHDVNDEWAPGSCHHDGHRPFEGPWIPMCWCSPPWAFEISQEAFGRRALRAETAARILEAMTQDELEAAAAADVEAFRRRIDPTPEEAEAQEWGRSRSRRSWGWAG